MINPSRNHPVRPASGRTVGWAASIMLVALLTATGCQTTDVEGDEPPRRPSSGETRVTARPPASTPAPSTPAPEPATGPSTPGAADFGDVFGAPTGRLGTEVPPPTTEPPLTEPPTTSEPPVTTAPPAAPPASPPAAPGETTGVPRTPVAPLGSDLNQVVGWIDDANELVILDVPTLPRVALDASSFTQAPSTAIPGGTVAAISIDCGVLGVLLDVDGTVAGISVSGPSTDSVVSVLLSVVIVFSDDDDNLAELLGHWDAAVVDGTDVLLGADDGGHWAVIALGGAASMTKLQDGSVDWVTKAHLLFELDRILALTPAET